VKELVLDVSKWDGDMNFAQWKQLRNLYGVIVKGGGSDVGRYVDSWFARNYDKVLAAGLHVGCYFYSKAMSVQEAIDDANYFFDNCLANREFDLPVYIDVEEPSVFNLGKRLVTDISKAFMDTINERGYKGGIYTGGYAWSAYMYGDDELGKYADWIAAWGDNPPKYIGVDYGMWQQGGIRLSDGNIVYDDVNGYVDCDWALIDYPSIINGGSPIDIPETTTPTGSVEDLMKVVYGELGYYAHDDPERGSKYGRWMAEYTGEDWMAGPSDEIWWCCMFVSWGLYFAHVRCAGFPSQNTDVALKNGAAAHLVDKSEIRRGDILIFDWNFATDPTDHIGFATGSPHDGVVETIEGNVRNSVKEMTRELYKIRYVVRPDYDGQGPTSTNHIDKPDFDAPLDIDGSGGYLTIHKWQTKLGTYADGYISGQNPDDYQYRRNIYAIEHDGGGSQLVEAIQQKIGAYVDGIWGINTTECLQIWLVKNGYDIYVDGDFGYESVKALQQSLNDGKWD